MLFDYRFWLRRFLEWLLNDSEEDECEKLVTKGIIGEPYFFYIEYLNFKWAHIKISKFGKSNI